MSWDSGGTFSDAVAGLHGPAIEVLHTALHVQEQALLAPLLVLLLLLLLQHSQVLCDNRHLVPETHL